jgi:hypothetical protein
MFITTVGIIAIMSMQPMSWRTATKSDLLGKSAEILQRQLETTELFIMNPDNTVTTGTTPPNTVFASGQSSAQTGDISFTVQTRIADNGNGSWTATVTVTDSFNSSISESLIVTRQEGFRS